MTSRRPAPSEYPPSYEPYVSLAKGDDPIAALEAQTDDIRALFAGVSEERSRHRYAEGKWSVRQIVGHVADAERVFGYRALRFARADETPLPAYEEDDWAAAAGHDDVPLTELVEELLALRRSHVLMLRHLPEGAFDRVGIANEKPISVRAIAFILSGHAAHHMKVLRERYGLSA